MLETLTKIDKFCHLYFLSSYQVPVVVFTKDN